MSNELPLKEISINELFWGSSTVTYEIPIYQRNYAWEKEEISALIQDVYDAFSSATEKNVYYIGTLVTFDKGDQVFEVIDGQQRLTTIKIILSAFDTELDSKPTNSLKYRARHKSDETIKNMPKFADLEEKDTGIVNGFDYAQTAINEIIPGTEKKDFVDYLRNNVHIIHYQVPKDINLNHYFEVMNSRGEQLEKPEIIKANLMATLPSKYGKIFGGLWNACSEMNVYVQRNFLENNEKLYGDKYNDFKKNNSQEFWDFIDKEIVQEEESVPDSQELEEEELISNRKAFKISELIDPEKNLFQELKEEAEKKDSFLSIIDFQNFLLMVLKLTRMSESSFEPETFNLDDKDIIKEFNKVDLKNQDFVKQFIFNLLKARFYLDNYIVHHSKEEDTYDSNPWKLQRWTKDDERGAPENLNGTNQDKLVQLLSMFEVSFTAKQRKNYLFYCLYYLLKEQSFDFNEYELFIKNLADRYFYTIYMDKSKLNDINTPMPGSFDTTILSNRQFNTSEIPSYTENDFITIYGDGSKKSKGIPLFVFNYLDYKLWNRYFETAKGLEATDKSRKEFFVNLSVPDFGLEYFNHFYFSRTRRSLEHYYPQAKANGEGNNLNDKEINCFGNYAMISSEANSSGSNWDPLTKITHYLKDASGKINKIGVASLKFIIMMKMCENRNSWNFGDIKDHQKIMTNILLQ